MVTNLAKCIVAHLSAFGDLRLTVNYGNSKKASPLESCYV